MIKVSEILATSIIEDILYGIFNMPTAKAKHLNIEFKKPTFVGRSFPRFSGLTSNNNSQTAKRSLENDQYYPADKITKHEIEDDSTISRLKKELNVVSSSLRYVTEDRDHWRKAANIARLKEEALAQENNIITARISGFEGQLTQQSNTCTGIMIGMMEVIWSLTENSSIVNNSLKDFQIQRLLKFSNSVLCTSLSQNNTLPEIELAGAVIGVLVNISAGGSAVIFQTEEGIEVIKSVADIIKNKVVNPRLCRLSLMFLYNLTLHGDIREDIDQLLPSISLMATSQILGKDGQSIAKKIEELLQNEKHFISCKQEDFKSDVEQ